MISRLECEMENAAARGAGALNLRIGDIGIALASGDLELMPAVQGAIERFLVNGQHAADARVSAAWGQLRQPAGGRIFDSGALWQLFRQGEDYVFDFTSPIYGPVPYKRARFNPDFTCGEVFLHRDYFDPGAPAFPLEYPLDEVLMTHLLARGRGIEVHACGVEDVDGRGYLFLGQSGDGKTTTARLWEKVGQASACQASSQKGGGVLVLSDDRIILRCLDGKIWMYGTPWHGEADLASPVRTPLTQVFFLGRGARNEVVPLRQPEAVARLVAGSFIPFYDAAGLDFTLEFLQQVTRAVPCMEFRFVPDGRAVDFVRRRAQSNG